MSKVNVSVIIPSYNRAHLLDTTIPTYVQEGVGEIIIIDDGSNDNTEQVARSLINKYEIIYYKKLDKNYGQMRAKNIGIRLANYDYIYFGDDDSIICENAIINAYNSLIANEADIVGIRALYMLENETYEDTINRCNNNKGKLYDIKKLKIDNTLISDKDVKVPYVQACFIIKSDIAKQVIFDRKYIGSGYREETDFILSCAQKGYNKIFYSAKAISINLPRKVATGGAWKQSWWEYEISAIKNNIYFLNKHYKYLKNQWGLTVPKWILNIEFIIERIIFRTKLMIKKSLRG